MTTWAARIAANDGRRPNLYFTIQGVPDVFQENVAEIPTTLEVAARPRRRMIAKKGITISPARLNMTTRRMEGGTVTATLNDDDAGTLAALFAPRARRASYITSNLTTTTSTINVASATSFTNSIAYIDGETVTFVTKTATQLQTVTRGAYSSNAQPHFISSDSTTGAGAWTVPPFWKGRRIYLWSYFVNDDGTTTSALARLEGTYSIEEAPQHTSAGVWEIRCADLSDSYWERKIGAGLNEIQCSGTVNAAATATGGTITLDLGTVERADNFVVGDVAAGSLGQTKVIVRLDPEQYLCCDLVSRTAATGIIVLSFVSTAQPAPVQSFGGGDSMPGSVVAGVRHVAILQDSPSMVALVVLTSRLGNNVNGGFDDLPGLDRAALGGPSFRMGAGILAADIDTAAFQRVGDSTTPWPYVIDDEITVGDFLFEFCLARGAYAYVTRAGLLSVETIAETSNVSVMTINDDDIVEGNDPKITYDEASIYPRVKLLLNYDPLRREHAGEFNVYASELTARYQDNDAVLMLGSKSICLEGMPLSKGPQAIQRQRVGFSDLQGRLRRIQVADGRGRGLIAFPCLLPVAALNIGQLVELTVDGPNLEGANVITTKLCRVLSVGPRWDDGEVDLELQMLEKLYVIAPAVRIASVAGAVLTLVTNAFEALTAGPGLLFAVGQPVQVWDVSAAVKDARTVLSVTATTVTLSSAPSFANENNVDFIRPANLSLAITTENDGGFDGFDYTYQMRADENASGLGITRWR